MMEIFKVPRYIKGMDFWIQGTETHLLRVFRGMKMEEPPCDEICGRLCSRKMTVTMERLPRVGSQSHMYLLTVVSHFVTVAWQGQ